MNNKKILTIDIGLKNLALCIMSASDSTDYKTYKLHLWNVYNILECDEDRLCGAMQKNGKICNKKCLYKYREEFTCKTHFPKNIEIKRNNNIKFKKIKDYLLQDIAKILLTKINEIFNDDIFKDLDGIYIELQPQMNKKMALVSHILYGKLVELYIQKNIPIRFVRASTKLKCYIGPPIECKLKTAYAKRKWLSIQYIKWFFENKFNNEEKENWLPFLLSHKKADDICDAMCYVLNIIGGIPKKQLMHKNGNELK